MIPGMADDTATRMQWLDDELAASRATVLRAIDQIDQLRSELEAEAERSVERRAEFRALVEGSYRRADVRRSEPLPPQTEPRRRRTDGAIAEADVGPPVRDRRRRPIPAVAEPIGINQQRFRA